MPGDTFQPARWRKANQALLDAFLLDLDVNDYGTSVADFFRRPRLGAKDGTGMLSFLIAILGTWRFWLPVESAVHI